MINTPFRVSGRGRRFSLFCPRVRSFDFCFIAAAVVVCGHFVGRGFLFAHVRSSSIVVVSDLAKPMILPNCVYLRHFISQTVACGRSCGFLFRLNLSSPLPMPSPPHISPYDMQCAAICRKQPPSYKQKPSSSPSYVLLSLFLQTLRDARSHLNGNTKCVSLHHQT